MMTDRGIHNIPIAFLKSMGIKVTGCGCDGHFKG